MAVPDDDVDRWHWSESVPLQCRVAVYSAELSAPNLVIHGRDRQHLDVIYNLGDALDSLNRKFCIGLHSWLRNLSEKCHFTAVDLVLKVVEYRVKRNSRAGYAPPVTASLRRACNEGQAASKSILNGRASAAIGSSRKNGSC